MTTNVVIEIPREVLHAAHMTPLELKRELALALYQQGKLSFGKARALAELDVLGFQGLLSSRDIPVHYDSAEYEADLATLEGLRAERRVG